MQAKTFLPLFLRSYPPCTWRGSNSVVPPLFFSKNCFGQHLKFRYSTQSTFANGHTQVEKKKRSFLSRILFGSIAVCAGLTATAVLLSDDDEFLKYFEQWSPETFALFQKYVFPRFGNNSSPETNIVKQWVESRESLTSKSSPISDKKQKREVVSSIKSSAISESQPEVIATNSVEEEQSVDTPEISSNDTPIAEMHNSSPAVEKENTDGIESVLELYNKWAESNLDKAAEAVTTVPVTKGEVLQRILHDTETVTSEEKTLPDLSTMTELEEASMETIANDAIENMTEGELRRYAHELLKELGNQRKYAAVRKRHLITALKEELYVQAFQDIMKSLDEEYRQHIFSLYSTYNTKLKEAANIIEKAKGAVGHIGSGVLNQMGDCVQSHEAMQVALESYEQDVKECGQIHNRISYLNNALSILSQIESAIHLRKPIGDWIDKIKSVAEANDAFTYTVTSTIPDETIDTFRNLPLDSRESIRQQLVEKLDSCTRMAFIPNKATLMGVLFSTICYYLYIPVSEYPSVALTNLEQDAETSISKIPLPAPESKISYWKNLSRNLTILGLARYYIERENYSEAVLCLKKLHGLPSKECDNDLHNLESHLLIWQSVEAVRTNLVMNSLPVSSANAV